MANKLFGQADPQYDALRVQSSQGIWPDAGGAALPGVGLENKIYVWHADGSSIDVFDPNEAGLTAALLAAVTGDTIWLPSISIALTATITIPANVTLVGISGQSELTFGTLVTPAIGLSDSSVLDHLYITQFANDTNDLTLVQGPTAGRGYLVHTKLRCEQAGAAGAVALRGGAGEIYAIDSTLSGESVTGGYAIISGDGLITLDDCTLIGTLAPIAGAGSVYTPGAEIATGSITVNSSSGNTISGLSIGALYCIEAYNAFDRKPAVHSWTNEISLSNDGGATWDGRYGANNLLNSSGDPAVGTGFTLTLPTFAVFGEFWGGYSTLPRIYFQATTTSVKIRVYDTFWGDNTGALSWRLRDATVGAGTAINVRTHLVNMQPVSGEPLWSDRSAWDTATYFDRHASDIADHTYTYHNDPARSASGTGGNIPQTYNETLLADGVSLTYYLVNIANPATIRVYIDGIRQPASDDTIPTDVVTFSVAPDLDALLLFDYELETA